MNRRLPFITAMPGGRGGGVVHQLELGVPVPREGRDDPVGDGGEPRDVDVHLAVVIIDALLEARLEGHHARETEQPEARQDDAQQQSNRPEEPAFPPDDRLCPDDRHRDDQHKDGESSTLVVPMTHTIFTTTPVKKTTTKTLVVFVRCQ